MFPLVLLGVAGLFMAGCSSDSDESTTEDTPQDRIEPVLHTYSRIPQLKESYSFPILPGLFSQKYLQDLELDPLKFRFDKEAKMDVFPITLGDLFIQISLPLDNNKDPKDGRIYLNEIFIFNPMEKGLGFYLREFTARGKMSPNYLKKLAYLRKHFGKNSLKESYINEYFHHTIIPFADFQISDYPRLIFEGLKIPDVEENIIEQNYSGREFVEKYRNDRNQEVLKAWYDRLGNEGKEYIPSHLLLFKDPESEITVQSSENWRLVKFKIVFDDDLNPKDNRVFFIETFLSNRNEHRTIYTKKWEKEGKIKTDLLKKELPEDTFFQILSPDQYHAGWVHLMKMKDGGKKYKILPTGPYSQYIERGEMDKYVGGFINNIDVNPL